MLSYTSGGSATKLGTVARSLSPNLDMAHGGGLFLRVAEEMRASPEWQAIPANEYTNLKSAEISGECGK